MVCDLTLSRIYLGNWSFIYILQSGLYILMQINKKE